MVVLELENRSAADLQSQAIGENRGSSVREQRRPVHLDYILAVNDCRRTEVRAEECVPGTNLPLAGADSCCHLDVMQRPRLHLCKWGSAT